MSNKRILTDQKGHVWHCNVVLERRITLRALRHKFEGILLLVGHCSIVVEHNIHLLRVCAVTQKTISVTMKSRFRNGQATTRQMSWFLHKAKFENRPPLRCIMYVRVKT
jgi:hypothetical protein